MLIAAASPPQRALWDRAHHPTGEWLGNKESERMWDTGVLAVAEHRQHLRSRKRLVVVIMRVARRWDVGLRPNPVYAGAAFGDLAQAGLDRSPDHQITRP